MAKRILALMLSVVMLFSITVSAYADDPYANRSDTTYSTSGDTAYDVPEDVTTFLPQTPMLVESEPITASVYTLDDDTKTYSWVEEHDETHPLDIKNTYDGQTVYVLTSQFDQRVYVRCGTLFDLNVFGLDFTVEGLKDAWTPTDKASNDKDIAGYVTIPAGTAAGSQIVVKADGMISHYTLTIKLVDELPQGEYIVELGDQTFYSDAEIGVAATNEEKAERTQEHFALEDNRYTHFFDISGEDGEETTISVAGLLDTNEHKNALVLHLLDSVEAIEKATTTGGVAWNYFTVEDDTQFAKEVAAAKAATGCEDNRVYYTTLNAEIADNGTITFQTDSFSTFMYIVTFEYEGHTYELSGGGTMYLSELMKGLNLSQSVSDVTAVSFSDATLVTAEQSQDDWIIRSENSFHTEEYMTLTFADGSSVEVKLTDPTVMYCVSHTSRLNSSGTEKHTINRSGASNNPYKSAAVVNTTTITTDMVNGSDSDNTTKDLVIYAAPGMAIRFASGIGFPDGSWEISKSNSGTYKHGNWEWVWSGNTNYILLNDEITESTYVDFNVTADSKTCNVRIWIIPNPSNNNVTKVHDTVKNSDTYEVRTIPVTLYDYDGSKWNSYWNKKNNGCWFAFSGRVQGVYTQNSVSSVPWAGGHLPNSGNLSQGIFTNKLDSNNLPVFASTAQTDVFGKTSNDAMGKTVYNDVGFEFIYEKKNGYYTYSSNLNHAQYNSSTNTIELYDQTLSSQIGAAITDQANTVAGFYPFQDIEKAIPNWGYNGSGWKGHLSDDYSTRNYGQYAWDLVHSTDEKATINLHFALQIEADFYMPTDKKSQVDKSNLVYEFTGDDDLWVFVDDQLVLDLGGAHSPISGKIDFTNETVYVQYYYPVTVGGNTYTDNSSADGYGKAKTFTFKELGINVETDQMHTLRVFYMERWSGESNCRMRFNLPLAPENSVMVSKELTNHEGKDFSVTPDVDYSFALYYAEDDDDNIDQPATAFKPWANKTYTIQGTSTTGTTDANGKFTLKAGQTAVFEGLPRFAEVYAVEYDNNDGYIYTAHLVSISGGTTQNYTLGSKADTKVIQRTGSLSYKFTNRMQTQPLTIEKKMASGLLDANQKFTFDLKFTKPILENGENAIKADDGKTLTNGKTFQLGAGESVTIPRVPVNMTFNFGEQNPDTTENSFDKPEYKLETVTCGRSPNDFTTYQFTVGNGGVNKITVTNLQRFTMKIIKKIEGGANPDQSFLFTVEGKDNYTSSVEMTVMIPASKFTSGEAYVSISGLPVGAYTVTEDENWSWRYELVGDNGKTVDPSSGGLQAVTFTNKRTNDKWLDGETVAQNIFTKESVTRADKKSKR